MAAQRLQSDSKTPQDRSNKLQIGFEMLLRRLTPLPMASKRLCWKWSTHNMILAHMRSGFMTDKFPYCLVHTSKSEYSYDPRDLHKRERDVHIKSVFEHKNTMRNTSKSIRNAMLTYKHKSPAYTVLITNLSLSLMLKSPYRPSTQK